MRVDGGAVVDEFDLPNIGRVVARHTRVVTPDSTNWACLFTVTADGNDDLAVVHRLSSPTFAESRRSVRYAVEFLAGCRLDDADPARAPQRNVPPGAVPLLGGFGEPTATTPVFELPPDRSPV